MRNMLIVDDTEISCSILKAIFDKEYNVIIAKNGKEAIEVLQARGFEIAVVLLDIMMPVKNGYEVLREMTDRLGLEHIPVIVISAFDDVESKVKVLKLGAADFINKPIEAEIVRQRVKNVVGRVKFEQLVNNDTEAKAEIVLKAQKQMYLYNCNEMDEFIRSACDIKKIFEYYRLVSPDTHHIYNYENGVLVDSGNICYRVWRRDEPCKNCISRRACIRNENFMKIEELDGVIYLIVAVPVEIGDKVYSVELVNNITNSMMINNSLSNENTEITKLIKEFNDIATRDTFTGLYNKAYINNSLDFLCNLVQENDEHIYGVIIDLDNFKYVNDTYGHNMGDEVLLRIASFLKQLTANNNGWAGRFGGDEFIMVFKDSQHQKVEELCQTLRSLVKNYTFKLNGAVFYVELSLGMDKIQPADSRESFVNRLDEKMYQEKKDKKQSKNYKR